MVSVERLVCNLCTIWVDRFKFHANIARFQRVPLNSNIVYEKKNVESFRGGVESFRGGDQTSRKDVGGADSELCGWKLKESRLNFGRGIHSKGLLRSEGELLDVDDQEESCFHSKRLCLYTKFHMKIFENFEMIFRGKVFGFEQWKFQDGSPNCWRSPMKRFNQMMGLWKVTIRFNMREVVVIIAMSEVPETNFDESIGPKVDLSDDPFGIYPLLNKNSNENKENVNEKDHSLKYPPGFTPNAEENDRNVNGDKSQKCNTKEVFAGRDGDSTNKGSKRDALESTPYAEENDRNVNGNKSQKCNTKEVFAGRDGDSTNRGSKGDASKFVCTRMFKKSEVPPVYALHDLRDKRMLWDYLVHTINQWDGEVVIMGDFNEVRYKSDRFGPIFNGQGVDEFNSFIANAGLEEVPLG
nr:RNA-directed DNA polymerase, eukaryota [Tanacetum cinerariifolium]